MLKIITKSKLKRFLGVLLILCVICMIAILGINSFIKATVRDRIIQPSEAKKLRVDCIIVLGAGVSSEGKPGDMLNDRLLQGIELYKTGMTNRIIMSGDHGRVEYDEVNVMKQFAIDKGIPSEHIFMDHAGFSTYESLYRARDIFQARKVVIVTQEYHLYRALYIADKLGLEAYGVPSNPRQYPGQTYRDLREVMARVKDFFFTIIKPKPTYLGAVIPVSGNGDLTNDKD